MAMSEMENDKGVCLGGVILVYFLFRNYNSTNIGKYIYYLMFTFNVPLVVLAFIGNSELLLFSSLFGYNSILLDA